jgi:hypothetical protein
MPPVGNADVFTARITSSSATEYCGAETNSSDVEEKPRPGTEQRGDRVARDEFDRDEDHDRDAQQDRDGQHETAAEKSDHRLFGSVVMAEGRHVGGRRVAPCYADLSPPTADARGRQKPAVCSGFARGGRARSPRNAGFRGASFRPRRREIDLEAQLDLAKAMVWAATDPRAADEAFNINNGDLFRWEEMWPRIAAAFELTVAPALQISL